MRRYRIGERASLRGRVRSCAELGGYGQASKPKHAADLVTVNVLGAVMLASGDVFAPARMPDTAFELEG